MELPPPAQVDCWFTAQTGQFRRYHSDDDGDSCLSGDEWGSIAGDSPVATPFEQPAVFAQPARLMLAEHLAMDCDSTSSQGSGGLATAQHAVMSYDSLPLHLNVAPAAARRGAPAALLHSTGSADLDVMDATPSSSSSGRTAVPPGSATPRLRHAFSVGDRLGSIEVSVAEAVAPAGHYWRDAAMGPLHSGLAAARTAAAQRLHSGAPQQGGTGAPALPLQALIAQQQQHMLPSQLQLQRHYQQQSQQQQQPPQQQQSQQRPPQQEQSQQPNGAPSPQTPNTRARPPRIVPPATSASWHDLSDAAAAGPLTTTTHGELPRLPRALSFLSIEDVDLDIADDLTPDAFRSGRSGFSRDQDLRRTALINRSGHLLGSPVASSQSPGGSNGIGSGAVSPCTPRGSIMGQAQHAIQHPGAPRRQPLAPSPLSPQPHSSQPARTHLQALREAWPELSDPTGSGRSGLTFAQELEHIRGLMPHRFREVAEMAHNEGWSLGLLGGSSQRYASQHGIADAAVPAHAQPGQQRAGTSSGAASPSSSHSSGGRGRLSPGLHCYQGGSTSSPHTPQQEPTPPHQQQLQPPLHYVQHRASHQRGQSLPAFDERHGGGELCPGCGARQAPVWGGVLGHDAGYSRRHDQGVQVALPPPALSGANAAAGVAAAAAAAMRQRVSYFEDCMAQPHLPQQQQVDAMHWRQCAERLAAERQQQAMHPQLQAQPARRGASRGMAASMALGEVARYPSGTSAATISQQSHRVRDQASTPASTPLQAVLADSSFLSGLLASLPGVDAAAPVVQQAVAMLRTKHSVAISCCGCGACSFGDRVL